MTQYLLGELSEEERVTFEEKYFDDPRLFDELTQAESALVDDFVRKRLAPETRRRFEEAYLTDRRRRERVEFAEALAARLDRADRPTRTGPVHDAPGWSAWSVALRGPQLALGGAAALVLLVASGWFLMDAQRARQQATMPGDGQLPAPATGPSDRDAEPLPPAADATAQPAPNPPIRPAPAVVSLALMVGPGERSTNTGPLPTVTIPSGTEQVRLALTLREHDYGRYRVIVRAIGGPELLRQGDLTPTAGPDTPGLTLTVPSERFEPGDYLLTLQGASAAGEYEDLSQTLFRVR